jgi:hypothetical protein
MAASGLEIGPPAMEYLAMKASFDMKNKLAKGKDIDWAPYYEILVAEAAGKHARDVVEDPENAAEWTEPNLYKVWQASRVANFFQQAANQTPLGKALKESIDSLILMSTNQAINDVVIQFPLIFDAESRDEHIPYLHHQQAIAAFQKAYNDKLAELGGATPKTAIQAAIRVAELEKLFNQKQPPIKPYPEIAAYKAGENAYDAKLNELMRASAPAAPQPRGGSRRRRRSRKVVRKRTRRV